MNVKKLAFLAAVGGFVTLGGMTFADEMHMQDSGNCPHMSGAQDMSGDMKGCDMKGHDMNHDEMSMLSGFIDYSTLTDDQKSALQSLIDTHKSDMQSLKSQFTGSMTDEQKSALQEQMKTLRTNFHEAVKTYVSADKLDKFNEMIAKMNEMKKDKSEGHFGSGHMIKDASYASGKDLKDGRMYKGASQNAVLKYIKGNTYNSIKSRLEAMSTDQLNTLLSKVETAITNVQNSNIAKKDLYVEVYTELKTIITQILGDSSTQESADLLNEILQAE